MSDQDEAQERITFGLTYSLDNSRCLRRECPSCGRQFKTETDESDLVSCLQPVFRQAGLEIGAAPDSETNEAPLPSLHCPYCGHASAPSDTLTRQFVDYLQRFIMREYLLPKVDKIISGFSDDINRSTRGSGGLISISIESRYSRFILPPRPIAGPEPADMKMVLMLCCGRHIKLLTGWFAGVVCPFCGKVAALQ